MNRTVMLGVGMGLLALAATSGCAMTESQQAKLLHEDAKSECRHIVDANLARECQARAAQLYKPSGT